MSGETPKNSGFVPTTIEGKGGISVSGSGHVVVANGGPGGVGAVIQEVFGQFSIRPTSLLQPAPGGPFVTLFSVPITTGQLGTKLNIQAALSGILVVGGGGTFVKGAIRVLVDGLDAQGLGASENGDPDAPNGIAAVSLSMQTQASIVPPVLPATTALHTVELQWEVLGDGADPTPNFSITDVDLDGATLIVRELS